MRIIKITAMWCSGCLIMNKVWNNIVKKYNVKFESLDLDLDSTKTSKYNVGNVLPVFIVLDNNDKEVSRFTGEYSEEKFINELKSVGVINEENN